ncbi:MAG TPA: amidase family protein [Vicinamibacterales bacterium]|nr:amidase family protein [Vicinamibacterales bacterium]
MIEGALERVQELNGTINAIVTINERALDDARALELRGRGNAGLLYGLPVGIKDVTPVKGLRTTYGSKLYADNVAKEDALVVQRLRQAGAVIIGKTNTPEFAAGGNTFNEVFGRTRNPWNLERSAGGSTGGGAAALATGMIALAEGTDLGGSLRIPASFCGVVGLRPSPGLVPTYPSDYVWDTLQVTGPMARTVEDVALMLQAICGPSPLSPIAQPAAARDFVGAVERGPRRGLRVAYCRDVAGIGIDEGIESVCRDMVFGLKQSGVHVEEVKLDLSSARPAFLALRGLWFVAQMHQRLDKIDQCSENVVNNVRAGLELTVKDIAAAEQVRGEVWHRVRRLLERYDHLVTPCMAVPPFPVERNFPETIAGEEMKTYVDWIAPTFVLSLTGSPVRLSTNVGAIQST